MRILQPPGWPAPSGYANGVAARGETVFIGGQIGWNSKGEFAEGLAAQVGQALQNIAEVLAVAGGKPSDNRPHDPGSSAIWTTMPPAWLA